MSDDKAAPRATFVRKRRSSRLAALLPAKKAPAAPAKRPYHTATGYVPVIPPADRRSLGLPDRPATSRRAAPSRGMRQGGAQQYAFSLGRADVRAPALTIPQLGTRWLSGLATALLVFLLYTLWTSSTFAVAGAELHGNQRLGAAEINAALHMTGEPIFTAVPAKLALQLRTAFPDLAKVSVHAGLPNRLVVNMVERRPVLAWSQGDSTTWIDASGIAFPPRGSVPNLIPVNASGTPPQLQADDRTPLYDRPFVQPQMVAAMQALFPYLPQGVVMTYDPQYGMGWQDPRGWSVYFGENTDDIAMKIQVYQAIVATLNQQGIQPSMISVEYADAPFYK